MSAQRYHFIGIGGIGMSALARILLDRGLQVSGSDPHQTLLIEELKKRGARIFHHHLAEHVPGSSTIVYSTDIPKNNPEYVEGVKLGLPMIHRSDLLLEVMRGYLPLLVSGTHGKTTTSSLLAHLLKESGRDPAYAIGGVVHSLGTNGQHGEGEYFVAEADESDGSFLKYSAFGAILTNVDNDHLNHWGTREALIKGFKTFADQVSSGDHFFWCKDDESLNQLSLKGLSYGFHEQADARILEFHQEGWMTYFGFCFEGKVYSSMNVPLVGVHNVLNATAVVCLALKLGLPEKTIRGALSSFQGVARRADKKGVFNGVEIYDDYGHHPTEVITTLHAIRKTSLDKRLVVVFQPHRYTRTKECLEQFMDAFESADELVLTDIYSAGEPPLPGITTEVFVRKIKEKRMNRVHYIPRSLLVSFIASFIRQGDILVTMGAGDVTKVGPELMQTCH